MIIQIINEKNEISGSIDFNTEQDHVDLIGLGGHPVRVYNTLTKDGDIVYYVNETEMEIK